MWVFDHWFKGKKTRGSSQSFPNERTARVSSRSIAVTNKSNSLTYTVASSFCQHLAVGCHHRRRILRYPHGFQFGRVKDFPADHMHACLLRNPPQTLFPPGFIVDAARQNPLIERRKECSFVHFFELVHIFGKSPRVSAGASFLSSFSWRSVLKFHSVGTSLMRNFDMYFVQRWTFIFSDVCLTQ